MPSYTSAEDKGREGGGECDWRTCVCPGLGTRGTSNSHSYSFRNAHVLCNSTRTHRIWRRTVSARASGILSLVSKMQESTAERVYLKYST